MSESRDHPPLVYKICFPDEWQKEDPVYLGSPDDVRDGFIHFSTAGQLKGTLDKHYRSVDEVLLLEFKGAELGDALKWEVSRDGALFPHLYGPLTKEMSLRCWLLQRGDDGFDLPQDSQGDLP